MRSEDVGETEHQKLVDSCIVADAIWFASKEEDVAVVSEDEDVIPGLLTASAFKRNVVWLNPAQGPRSWYLGPLQSQKVRHSQC